MSVSLLLVASIRFIAPRTARHYNDDKDGSSTFDQITKKQNDSLLFFLSTKDQTSGDVQDSVQKNSVFPELGESVGSSIGSSVGSSGMDSGQY